jgi:hypothetical protein
VPITKGTHTTNTLECSVTHQSDGHAYGVVGKYGDGACFDAHCGSLGSGYVDCYGLLEIVPHLGSQTVSVVSVRVPVSRSVYLPPGASIRMSASESGRKTAREAEEEKKGERCTYIDSQIQGE